MTTLAGSRTKSKPGSLKVPSLPDVLTEHHATPSIRDLFDQWVRRADKTDNGIIQIVRTRRQPNSRTGKPYSPPTVDAAIKWLTARHLLMKTEQGIGGGNGSRYFVRWSFDQRTLTARQKAVNHLEYVKRVKFTDYAREEAYKLLEEELKKQSLYKYKTSSNVPLVENAKPETSASEKNKQQRRLREERAVRWAMACMREATTDEDALEAAAHEVRRALAGGQVWIGPELKKVVQRLAFGLECLDEAWPESPQDKFSYVGFHAWGLGLEVYSDRARYAERQGRKREREEAKASPIGDFSCREYNAVRAKHRPNGRLTC